MKSTTRGIALSVCSYTARNIQHRRVFRALSMSLQPHQGKSQKKIIRHACHFEASPMMLRFPRTPAANWPETVRRSQRHRTTAVSRQPLESTGLFRQPLRDQRWHFPEEALSFLDSSCCRTGEQLSPGQNIGGKAAAAEAERR